MATLGIDLGTSSIKIAKVSGKRMDLLAVVSNPLGKVLMDTEHDRDGMAEVIKRLLSENKISERRFKVSISESVVYSRVITLPVLTDAELASAIKWEAEQYVPVPLDEVELSWEVVDRPVKRTGGEKMRVYLAAADKKLVNGLVAVFTKIGLEPDQIEPELIPTARAIVLERKLSGATLLCTMGASSTGMGVFENDQLLFVYKSNSGGVALTRAIMAALQLSLAQAEEYKRTYGASNDVLEGKLLQAMKPVLDSVVVEMRRTINFYMQTFPGGQISRIVLSGGGALMPGLVSWLSSQVGIEVSIGDPFEGLNVQPTMTKLGPVYSAVIGVTARE